MQYCRYSLEPPDKCEQFSFLFKNECRGYFSVWMACRHSKLNAGQRNHFLSSFITALLLQCPHHTSVLVSIRLLTTDLSITSDFSQYTTVPGCLLTQAGRFTFLSLVAVASTLWVVLCWVTAVWRFCLSPAFTVISYL